ncbi:hypothetical protein HAX54_034237 [Datura stramonium]|uniref:BURP domain-containing protein n=1 Tax=Datura stramonium TaxID=4076 RepID=A0ABS8VF30_DATST|nr:hypothetical protein [Datura stramonium]
MKLQALTIFLLAIVASTYAAISPEVYWKVKLPNTQIPKVIKDFLPQSELKQENTNTKEKVYYGLSQYGTISWHRAATKDEIRHFATKKKVIKQVTEGNLKEVDGPLKQYFFLENDLEKGKVIDFPTLLNKNEAPFLPRRFVDSIPLSMEKFEEILSHFSIDSKSKDAQAIKKTIELCEEPEVKHKEKRTCATSLESMVDFGLTILGTNNIMAITSKCPWLTKTAIKTSLC